MDKKMRDFIFKNMFTYRKYSSIKNVDGSKKIINNNGDDELYVGIDVIAEAFNEKTRARGKPDQPSKRARSILNGEDKFIKFPKAVKNTKGDYTYTYDMQGIVPLIRIEYLGKNGKYFVKSRDGVNLRSFMYTYERYLEEIDSSRPDEDVSYLNEQRIARINQTYIDIKNSSMKVSKESLVDLINDYNDDYYALLDRYDRLKNSVVIRKNEYHFGAEYVKGAKYNEWINHIKKSSKK